MKSAEKRMAQLSRCISKPPRATRLRDEHEQSYTAPLGKEKTGKHTFRYEFRGSEHHLSLIPH